MIAEIPFWQRKRLEDMTAAEWESLCDGCGKCCLVKLEEEQTGEVYYTELACSQMDTATCQCQSYGNRQQVVPECTADAGQHRTVPLAAIHLRLPDPCRGPAPAGMASATLR